MHALRLALHGLDGMSKTVYKVTSPLRQINDAVMAKVSQPGHTGLHKLCIGRLEVLRRPSLETLGLETMGGWASNDSNS